MDFRIRPKSDYLHTANWQQLYVLTGHWQSDLHFYKDEVRFFRHLVEKKLIWLEQESNIYEVRTIDNMLLSMEQEASRLEDKMRRHLFHLGELYENPTGPTGRAFREEHALLEDQLANFVKSFRGLKRGVFDVVERVTESERS